MLNTGELNAITDRARQASDEWIDEEDHWVVFQLEHGLGPVEPFRRHADATFVESARHDMLRLLDEIGELSRLLLESHRDRERLEEHVRLLAFNLAAEIAVRTGLSVEAARHIVEEMLREWDSPSS